MVLASVVDSLDAVPAEHRALYVEQDGNFVVECQGLEDHPRIRPLANAHKRVMEETEDALARLAAAEQRLAQLPPDFDPAEWRRLKARNRNANPEAHAEHLQAMAELKLATDATTAELRASIAKERSERLADRAESITIEAMGAAGVPSNMLRGALAVFRSEHGEVMWRGEDAFVEHRHHWQPIAAAVQRWAMTNEGMCFCPNKNQPKSGSFAAMISALR